LDLYLIRHAVAQKRDAERWPDDSKRPLTPEGEERFRRAAGGILRLVPEVGVVLSSPFIRTWQTAEIMEQAGWPAPVPTEELEPDHSPRKILKALARYAGAKESVALVGHRPQLHDLASYLLTGNTRARIQIKKGGVVSFSFDHSPESGKGYFEWLLTPEALQAMS
jgi:phosphohistidine phosphatase